jgi:hypothetical protein
MATTGLAVASTPGYVPRSRSRKVSVRPRVSGVIGRAYSRPKVKMVELSLLPRYLLDKNERDPVPSSGVKYRSSALSSQRVRRGWNRTLRPSLRMQVGRSVFRISGESMLSIWKLKASIAYSTLARVRVESAASQKRTSSVSLGGSGSGHTPFSSSTPTKVRSI